MMGQAGGPLPAPHGAVRGPDAGGSHNEQDVASNGIAGNR